MNAISTVAPAALAALIVWLSVMTGAAAGPRSFATAEDAVKSLIAAANAGSLDELKAIFGPESQDLIASSDPATGRRNREVFVIAVKERWRLVDEGKGKTLVIGYEDWPFPVPLVTASGSWHFDTAAGKEAIIARRIGRNELSAIDTCRAYVTAQQRYAQQGHDGLAAGVYAKSFASDPGKENGLYWPTAPRRRSAIAAQRLLLQDPDLARRLRARRLARRVQRHRRDDVPGQSGGQRAREGPRHRDRRGGAPHDRAQRRFLLASLAVSAPGRPAPGTPQSYGMSESWRTARTTRERDGAFSDDFAESCQRRHVAPPV